MQLNRILLLWMLLAFTCGINTLRAQDGPDNKKEIRTNKWRIALNGGIGYRLASTKESKQALINQGFDPSDVDSYFNEIKWGPKASAQVHYLINSTYGVGIDYQFHHSSGSLTGTISNDGFTYYYGESCDNIYTNYVGPSFYSNEWLVPNKLKWYAQTSIGLTLFRQENVSFYTPVLITGKALGINLETGLDYFVHKNIAIGIQLNYFQSTISKIKVDDGSSTSEIELEKEQREGLGRLDAGAGVRFYF